MRGQIDPADAEHPRGGGREESIEQALRHGPLIGRAELDARHARPQGIDESEDAERSQQSKG